MPGAHVLFARDADRCSGILREKQCEITAWRFTPSEIAASLEYGYKTMKLFPAGAMPLNYVKSLKGPFDQGNYVAIGGVCPSNYKAFSLLDIWA